MPWPKSPYRRRDFAPGVLPVPCSGLFVPSCQEIYSELFFLFAVVISFGVRLFLFCLEQSLSNLQVTGAPYGS